MKFLLVLTFFSTTFLCQAQTYTAKKFNALEQTQYKVQYPASWTIDTSKKRGADFIIFSPLENENDKFRENINLLIQDLTGRNIDLDAFTNISLQQINAINATIYDSGKITANNQLHYKVVYGRTQGAFNLKIEQYYFIKNEKAYILTFTAESAKFDRFKEIEEKVLNSFILKD